MKTLVRLSLIFIGLAALLHAQESKSVQWSVALARPAIVGEEVEVVITARIAPEWIVYSSDFKADIGPQATRIILEVSEAFRLVGELASVAPKRKKDKTWDTEFGYFETRAEFRQKLKVVQAAPVIVGRIKGQLCNERDGTCTLFEHAFKLWRTFELRTLNDETCPICIVRFVASAKAGFAAEAVAPAAPATKAELGERLFFDPLLSRDRTVSCASCHKPEHAFADNVAFSPGVRGQLGHRNTPSAMNGAGRLEFFWDSRASSLEEQALGPIANPAEMDLPLPEAIARLNADAGYAKAFAKLYGGPATEKNLASAIAAFERTLETGNTPYDRYVAGDDSALTPAGARGRLLFIGKANCASCHSGEDFTADRQKNIGLYNGKDLNDEGRFGITKNPEHLGLFKIPSLRNVAVTAPYMHNGMFKTLREVVGYYNAPETVVKDPVNRDKALDLKLSLTAAEVDDVVAFLEALTDDRFTAKKSPGVGRATPSGQ